MKYLFCFGIGKVRISAFSIIALAAMLYSDFSFFTLELIAAAAIHESGHLIAMRLFGADIFSVCILPCGVVISSDCTKLSYKKEALTALSGIAANLVTGGTALAAWFIFKDIYLLFFVFCSLFFAVINLIPVKTFDGARALKALLLHYFCQEKTDGIMDNVYYFAFLLLVLASLYVLVVTDGNFSLVILLCVVFISVYAGEEDC